MSETINTLPVPINFTPAGAVPRLPADLQADLLALVSSENPGYTNTLPFSMIEDLSSTAVGALQLIDQAWVTTINSVSPQSANAYLLSLIGGQYGLVPGQPTNTTVPVQFTSNTPGFPIPIGFVISDGTNQYALTDPTVIQSGGTSPIVTATAVNPGAFPVPQGTVTTVVTGIPSGVTLTVTNPQAGTPSTGTEPVPAFRARVLEATQAISVGVTTAVKSALKAVAGVNPRLVSLNLISGIGWEIICGGGDIYAVANAIFLSIGGDLPLLTGSVMEVVSITNANPGVVTTNINHGFTTGAIVTINGATGISGINGVPLTITVLSATTFSIGINTTSSGTYTGSGVVTPNNRNVVAAIADSPNTYNVPFVIPPQQVVTMTVTWNTSNSSFAAAAAVSNAVIPNIVGYINSIVVGQPINILALNDTFLNSLTGIINPALITRLVFAVSINGVGASVVSGEQIILSDPESYFYATVAGIVVSQG